ncbi:Hint domain-containing protein [Aliiruegeria haliotis]|uniref:Hint domain-containing protein n=1 Tax=Aliiruegeria haliotis TaxID=1280846 RepID=A0A2T0RVP8_9RHOB|nr:Hint domain-containing protein [Aliiruegeria haliotis]PRY25251.1 Hint domain-containing protein [Aliiruegeria haliotis]
MPDDLHADYHCHVLPGDCFSVISGANLGDPLLEMEELCPGDVYRLASDAQALQLAIADSESSGGQVLSPGAATKRVAPGTEFGTPGASIELTARLTFLAPEGHKVDLLLLEVTSDAASKVAALPLEPMAPGQGHTLIGIDEAPGAQRLADITSLAFGRGTHVTLADGRQARVEDLQPGDRLLTRDHGPQPLRRVIKRTVRAVGPYAPVVIPNETLGNAGDLILSQHQRLFIYQRGEDRLTATAEMLVKAAYLVDDEKIYIRPGGYTDFFTLVFDHHEVIYAECIPVESLEVNSATLATLPKDIAREVGDAELEHRPHIGTEADRIAGKAARDRLLKDRNPR